MTGVCVARVSSVSAHMHTGRQRDRQTQTERGRSLTRSHAYGCLSPPTHTTQVEGPPGPEGVPTKVEYRVWNPFRSKLAAAILGGAS